MDPEHRRISLDRSLVLDDDRGSHQREDEHARGRRVKASTDGYTPQSSWAPRRSTWESRFAFAPSTETKTFCSLRKSSASPAAFDSSDTGTPRKEGDQPAGVREDAVADAVGRINKPNKPAQLDLSVRACRGPGAAPGVRAVHPGCCGYLPLGRRSHDDEERERRHAAVSGRLLLTN
jgi:hypothetical protein